MRWMLWCTNSKLWIRAWVVAKWVSPPDFQTLTNSAFWNPPPDKSPNTGASKGQHHQDSRALGSLTCTRAQKVSSTMLPTWGAGPLSQVMHQMKSKAQFPLSGHWTSSPCCLNWWGGHVLHHLMWWVLRRKPSSLTLSASVPRPLGPALLFRAQASEHSNQWEAGWCLFLFVPFFLAIFWIFF